MKNTAKILTGVLSVLLMLLTACSKDSNTVARELMGTIPSNAAAVILIDGEQLAEKAGGQNDVLNILTSFCDTQTAPLLKTIAENWTPTAALIFKDGENSYITTRLDDSSKLMAEVEKRSGSKLSEDGDMKYNGHIAFIGDQVWIATTGSSIVPANMKAYTKYSENQSFVSVEYADTMLDSDKDMSGLLNISSFVSLVKGNLQQTAMIQMALSALFDNAAYLSVDMEFKKGEAEFDSRVLTSKFKAAKFLIPVGKIDPEVVKRTSESAGAIVALCLDSKTMNKIKDIASSVGGALPDEWLKIADAIDGTIAVAAEQPGSNLRGIITTTGENTLTLSQVLASLDLQTLTEGKDLIFSQGTAVAGNLEVAKEADKFKNAWLGVIIGEEPVVEKQLACTVYMLITPKNGSLELNGKAAFADKTKNALALILPNLKR